MIFVEAGDDKAVQACMEKGLRHGGLGAMVGDVARLPMVALRQLHLAAKESGIWVVWALPSLFGSALGEHLVFKGETSLSKAYVPPSMMLEFGALSTGEPESPRDVICDATGFVEGLAFPVARPRVMHAERTF